MYVKDDLKSLSNIFLESIMFGFKTKIIDVKLKKERINEILQLRSFNTLRSRTYIAKFASTVERMDGC